MSIEENDIFIYFERYSSLIDELRHLLKSSLYSFPTICIYYCSTQLLIKIALTIKIQIHNVQEFFPHAAEHHTAILCTIISAFSISFRLSKFGRRNFSGRSRFTLTRMTTRTTVTWAGHNARVRLHLWHTGVSTYSRIRGPGYIIVLRAQRGAQPTCNANTQRGL